MIEKSALMTVRLRVPAASVTRSTRVVPGSEGPSALVMPADPSAVRMASTVRRLASVVPIASISVPRSMPAASAGAPSKASATNRRRAAVSVDRRIPKPAVEPDEKKAFSSLIDVR